MNVTVIEGSIRALAPSHPGSAVLYIGELNFITDIVGDSPELAFSLAIPAMALLLNDDISNEEGHDTTSISKGVALWKVGSLLFSSRTTLRVPTAKRLRSTCRNNRFGFDVQLPRETRCSS